MKRTRTLPPMCFLAELAAETADDSQRTVELVFYTGAPVLRVPLFGEPHELVFAMTAKAAKLERLNAGAPLVDSHRTFDGVRGQLGVVERAWLSSGLARASVRFSKRDDVTPVWNDVRDRIVRNVSMGVYLHELEEVTVRGAELRRFQATSWEPYEISLVPTPADVGAQIQAAAATESRPCRIHFHDGEQNMKRKCPKCLTKLAADYTEKLCPNAECAVDLEEAESERDEMARRGEAHRLAAHFELGDVWAQAQIRSGATRQEMKAAGIAERARLEPQIDGRNPSATRDYESPGAQLDAMAEALSARARGVEPSGPGRRFYGERLVDLAYHLLRARGMAHGLDVRHHPGRIVELAHGTSDFPLLLGNVLNKMLLPAYETAQPTYRIIAARKPFNDFRAHRFFLRRGDFPVPLQVGENGEITEGTLGENQEQVSVLTFGRIFAISRQALVNDDLGALNDLALGIAQRVADFENSHFFNVCILPAAGLGPNLSDGVATYNATHGNLTAAGALDLTRLGEGRALMMAQRGIPSQAGATDGIYLNVQPRFLLVSPASLTLGEQLTTQITPATFGDANPFQSRLVAIGDAHLSGTRFYLLADPARLPQYIYGHLEGMDGPRVDVRAGWTTDGTEVRVVDDFGVGVVESRAGVSGAGA